jgi:hypothetical protein
MEKLTSQGRVLMICIMFYCDIEPTSKTMVPWLVRNSLVTMLYDT